MRIALIIMFMAASWAYADGQQTIVANGRSGYRIVLRKDASPSEKRGADEIQMHIEHMSRVKLPIVTEDQAPREKEIVVGIGQRSNSAGPSAKRMS